MSFRHYYMKHRKIIHILIFMTLSFLRFKSNTCFKGIDFY